MKKKILIYSDCFTYSGSELVVENIMNSNLISQKYNCTFYYSYSWEYHKKFTSRNREKKMFKSSHRAYLLNYAPFLYNFRKTNDNLILKYIYFVIASVVYFFQITFFIEFYNIAYLFFIIYKNNPDTLFINNGGYPGARSARLAVFISRTLKIKKVIFNINNLAFPPRCKIEEYIDYYINKYVHVFITASYEAQKQAIRQRHFDIQKFKRIPNTIFSDILKIDNNKNLLNKTNFNIVSVGLLTKRKGFAFLIQAMSILKKRGYKDIHLTIVGDGEEKSILYNIIHKENLHNCVFLTGYKSDPQNYIKDCDLFVLPSISNEDFPYVILEAMLLRKPIIASFIAGIPEQIKSGYNGYLTKPADKLDLVEKIELIYLSHNIGYFGSNSFNLYKKEYSYNYIENMYLELFDEHNSFH